MSWLPHILGLDNASGGIYLFWSGFGGDLGYLAVVGGLFAHYKRSTCHVNDPRFCWRPGVHPVAGTPYKACRKHHPAVPEQVSAQHIADAHEQAVDQ